MELSFSSFCQKPCGNSTVEKVLKSDPVTKCVLEAVFTEQTESSATLEAWADRMSKQTGRTSSTALRDIAAEALSKKDLPETLQPLRKQFFEAQWKVFYRYFERKFDERPDRIKHGVRWVLVRLQPTLQRKLFRDVCRRLDNDEKFDRVMLEELTPHLESLWTPKREKNVNLIKYGLATSTRIRTMTSSKAAEGEGSTLSSRVRDGLSALFLSFNDPAKGEALLDALEGVMKECNGDFSTLHRITGCFVAARIIPALKEDAQDAKNEAQKLRLIKKREDAFWNSLQDATPLVYRRVYQQLSRNNGAAAQATRFITVPDTTSRDWSWLFEEGGVEMSRSLVSHVPLFDNTMVETLKKIHFDELASLVLEAQHPNSAFRPPKSMALLHPRLILWAKDRGSEHTKLWMHRLTYATDLSTLSADQLHALGQLINDDERSLAQFLKRQLPNLTPKMLELVLDGRPLSENFLKTLSARLEDCRKLIQQTVDPEERQRVRDRIQQTLPNFLVQRAGLSKLYADVTKETQESIPGQAEPAEIQERAEWEYLFGNLRAGQLGIAEPYAEPEGIFGEWEQASFELTSESDLLRDAEESVISLLETIVSQSKDGLVAFDALVEEYRDRDTIIPSSLLVARRDGRISHEQMVSLQLRWEFLMDHQGMVEQQRHLTLDDRDDLQLLTGFLYKHSLGTPFVTKLPEILEAVKKLPESERQCTLYTVDPDRIRERGGLSVELRHVNEWHAGYRLGGRHRPFAEFKMDQGKATLLLPSWSVIGTALKVIYGSDAVLPRATFGDSPAAAVYKPVLSEQRRDVGLLHPKLPIPLEADSITTSRYGFSFAAHDIYHAFRVSAASQSIVAAVHKLCVVMMEDDAFIAGLGELLKKDKSWVDEALRRAVWRLVDLDVSPIAAEYEVDKLSEMIRDALKMFGYTKEPELVRGLLIETYRTHYNLEDDDLVVKALKEIKTK